MDTKTLRDRNNKVMGRIESSMSEPEILVARDPIGHVVGRYDPDTDTTYDEVGRRVGEGNLLAMLF